MSRGSDQRTRRHRSQNDDEDRSRHPVAGLSTISRKWLPEDLAGNGIRAPEPLSSTTSMRSRRLALHAAKWAAAITDPLFGKRPGPRVLIYHQVGADSGLEMDVAVDVFHSQMAWLASHGRVVGLDEAVERAGRSVLESDDYVITFDDGHLGVYQYAFPYLAENSIPFTLYLTTAPLEADGYLHDDRSMPTLNWAQVNEMVSTGLVTIGSHSHRHLDARRHDGRELESDLLVCDETIAKRTGIKPQHYAYPWGHWSSQADPIVRARYRTASVGSGPGLGPGFDPHRLPRLPVMASDGDLLFRRKMWGGFRLETGLRRLHDLM